MQAFEDDYGVRFADLRILGIVWDMVSFNFLAANSRLTHVRSVRVAEMMTILRGVIPLSKNWVRALQWRRPVALRTLMTLSSTYLLRWISFSLFRSRTRLPRTTKGLPPSRQIVLSRRQVPSEWTTQSPLRSKGKEFSNLCAVSWFQISANLEHIALNYIIVYEDRAFFLLRWR